MGVDLLERIEQPHPALAVEAADRAAQAQDRLGQFLFLRDVLRRLAVEFGQFLLGDQVDRPDPLALGRQAIEAALFLVGRVEGRVGRRDVVFVFRHLIDL